MKDRPGARANPGETRFSPSSMVLLAVVLAAAWLLWSGFFKPLLLGLGVFSCLLVLLISYRMRLFGTEAISPGFILRLFRFWLWLGREIVRSSLQVTRVVLSPKLPINPTVTEFDSSCSRPLDLAILGNSITLTPGTLTVRIDKRHFLVHALTEEGASDVASGEMDRRVSELRAD